MVASMLERFGSRTTAYGRIWPFFSCPGKVVSSDRVRAQAERTDDEGKAVGISDPVNEGGMKVAGLLDVLESGDLKLKHGAGMWSERNNEARVGIARRSEGTARRRGGALP
jgi:hypothetical protein